MNNNKIRVGLYARISTSDKGQTPELQLTPLREYCKARGWTVSGEYVDKGISAVKDRRPQLDKLVNDAKKRRLDYVLVWRLDRWGRSLKHLINSLSELQALGIAFVSYQENIDLSTPAGKMMFHIVGAMAEFERSLIIERVKAGMEIARLRGQNIGRTPTAPHAIKNVLDAYISHNLSVRDLAIQTSLPKSTCFRLVQKFNAGKIDREGIPLKVSQKGV
jgi:DNA invertase Pin-like site-specific DNA recombinase